VHYDPVRDFAHVALVVANPAIIVVHPGFAPRNLGELVALSKRERRGLDYATSGPGSSNHLLMVQVAAATGANLNHIPYRGAGPAMTDVIAGVVPMLADSLPSSAAHLRAGSVRGLAMASEARLPTFPDVPTFREQGVDLLSTSWFGISAPARTPAAIVERLNHEVVTLLAQPAVRERFATLGGTVGALSAEGYTAFVQAEVTRWAPVVRASGATVD
jgi:tripartite-type tricarboxylate transporter receptor subunit TctC